ncbi:MAG: LPP20 family lipoprotein [Armatimonadetes bacterium]|nr:LPP20 family lipoprotein [Armatimonadota bacterium]
MTRRNVFLAALSLTLLSLPTLPTQAQLDGDPYVDVVAQGKGRINYAAGVVKATGYGAPPTNSQNPAQARLMAMGAAKADALRNLAMAVSSIQVTATTKVKNYVTESDTVETKVTAILQNARIISEIVGKDGMASVTVEIPMYGRGSVASAVMAEAIMEPRRESPSREPVRREPEPEPLSLPERGIKTNPRDPFKEPRGGAKPIKVEPRKPKAEPKNYHLPITSPIEEGPFTSVIVDCRGLGIQAVMSPKIYDTNGREVYGTLNVDVDYAIEIGIVGYPRSVEEALASKRAGEKPLVVRALRAKDSSKIDVVLSNEDGKRILEESRRDGFLEKCRVILLCDPVR